MALHNGYNVLAFKFANYKLVARTMYYIPLPHDVGYDIYMMYRTSHQKHDAFLASYHIAYHMLPGMTRHVTDIV